MVGEAADGEEALALLRRWPTTGDPLPDVVLMDLQHAEAWAASRRPRAISRAHPEVRVVVLTSFGEVERVHAALAAGAAGYLLKDAEPAEVATAIRAAAAARCTSTPRSPGSSPGGWPAPQAGAVRADRPGARDPRAGRAGPLQPRDRRASSVISERTARTHVSNVLSKLKLTSRTQAALLAIREGLIPPPA